jgi:chorismate mutase
MSPKNKIKLNKLRKRLDILDSGLLNVIKKRSYLVNEVLKLKNYKNEIIDKKRINFILKKIIKFI